MVRKKRYPELYGEEKKDQDEVELVSKSHMKREMHHLQELGEALLNIKADEIIKLNLSVSLQDALTETRKIKHREGLRRQMQFVGKLMRKEPDETVANIEDLLERKRNQHNRLTQQQHLIEQWRDRILDQGTEGIDAFIIDHPEADRQWLRQIMRQGQQERSQNTPPAAARKLFAYIRDLLLVDNR